MTSVNLRSVRDLYAHADPVPSDLTERMKFAISVQALHAEVAELMDSALLATRGRDAADAEVTPTPTDSVTFTAASVSVMVSWGASDTSGADDRVRVDGWVTSPGAQVEAVTADGNRSATSDANGRFVLDDLPHGPIHFLVTDPTNQGNRPVHHSDDPDLSRVPAPERGRAATIDLLERARTLRERGSAENLAGRPVSAARTLGEALDEIDRLSGQAPTHERLELRCNTLITLAMTEFMLSGVDAAMARLGEAQKIVDELGDGGLRARLNYQRANIHGRGGRPRVGLGRAGGGSRPPRCLHPARTVLGAPEPGDAGPSSCSGPKPRSSRLPRPPASPTRSGGREQEFMARHNAGYAAYLRGDIPRSLAGMAEADRLEADVFRAPSRLDRVRVLLEAGLVREAIETLEAGAAELSVEGHEQARAEFRPRGGPGRIGCSVISTSRPRQPRRHRRPTSASAPRPGRPRRPWWV